MGTQTNTACPSYIVIRKIHNVKFFYYNLALSISSSNASHCKIAKFFLLYHIMLSYAVTIWLIVDSMSTATGAK